MLCDVLVEYLAKPRFDQHQDLIEGLRFVGQEVRDCPRFVLDRAAAMMVQTVSSQNIPSFADTLPLCRLPYPKLWVEMSFRDRLDWVQEQQRQGIELSRHEASQQPQRLGFLIEQVGEGDTTILVVQPVWNFGDKMQIARMALAILIGRDVPQDVKADILRKFPTKPQKPDDPKTPEEIDAWAEMAARVTHFVPPWLEPYWNEAQRHGQARVDEEKAVARYDLAAEWRFVMALLIVLNSKNLVSVQPEADVAKLNKARARSGKVPLLPHHPVVLNLSKAQRGRVMALATGLGRASLDPHLVRGHFKLRKTGIFWWSPHTRGGAGATPPTYRITA